MATEIFRRDSRMEHSSEKQFAHAAVPDSGASDQTRTIVLTALLAAMACVATMIIKIPSPTNGYMNLGDTVVLLAAYLLGPVYGAIAGGVGSALADFLSGYMVYVPATLIIKALMGVAAGVLYRRNRKAAVAWAVLAEAIMVTGYWLFDGFLSGSLAASAAGLPSNLVQAAFGIVLSTLLLLALRHNAQVRRQFPNL